MARLSSVLVLPLVAATSCGFGAKALPPQPLTVRIIQTEYRFDFDHTVHPGRVVFRTENKGRLNHEMVLAPLPEDVPPLTFDPHSPIRRGLATLALLPRRQPGAIGTFAVDLDPGRYVLICFVKDADGVQHATKGMHAEFRVS